MNFEKYALAGSVEIALALLNQERIDPPLFLHGGEPSEGKLTVLVLI